MLLPALLLYLAVPATASDDAVLESIDYASQPERAQLTLHLSKPVQFTSGRLANPDRIYIDLAHSAAAAAPALPSVPAEDAIIRQIRIGLQGTDTLRVVIDLKSPASFSIVQANAPPRLLLILRPAHPPSLTKLEGPAVPSGAAQIPLPSPPPLHPQIPSGPILAEMGNPAPPAGPPPTPALAPPSPSIRPAPSLPPSRTLTIPRVSRPPRIEEFLHGVPPQPGARIDDFRQREPGDGVPASEPTTAWLSYDERNLYVVFVCKEEPAKLRANMAKREDISNDDQVAVYFDTFRDRRHAYLFAVNPLGIQSDAIFTEGQSDPDYSFDTLWYSEGRLTPDGYVVSMSIPFKSVRFANENQQTWSVALRRTIPRNNENSYWPYITNRTTGMLQQMAEMNGLSEISPGRNIQLIPYGTFTSERSLNSNQPPLVTQNDARVGMDAKAVLGNALTLDVTLNPDFSQVESDDPQVTINQRYEVYFPEKRPFFVENASYFKTPIDLFFSRRIADPEFGAKLTGKIGHWDLGVLASDDRAPGEGAPTDNPLSGARAADGVFSLRRELGDQSTIGVLATTQDFGSNSNRVFSVDTRLRLAPTWFFTGQAVHSFDHQAGSSPTQGSAYFADLARNGRHFTYEGSYSDYSPDFNARLGYIKRVDLRKTEHYATYLWRPESSSILDFGPFAGAAVDWDHHGVLQDWYANAGFSMDFKGPSGFRASRYETFERYLNVPFRYDKNDLYFYTGRLRWLYIYGTIDQGSGVNYDPAGTLLPFLGKTIDASFGVTLRPKPRLKLDELYYYDRFQSFSGPVVYTNHLWRTKLNYQFTKALSLRAIIDYYGVLPNVDLIQQGRLKQVTGDILLTWLLNPGTALYIGYNNQHQNLALDPDAPGTLRPYGPPNYLTNSQIFIKLSYLLRF